MKARLFLVALGFSNFLVAQNTTPQNAPLVSVSKVETKGNEPEQPNDEGTNNPVLTGSTEYIQGDKKYYVKKNENITIIFEEKPH